MIINESRKLSEDIDKVVQTKSDLLRELKNCKLDGKTEIWIKSNDGYIAKLWWSGPGLNVSNYPILQITKRTNGRNETIFHQEGSEAPRNWIRLVLDGYDAVKKMNESANTKSGVFILSYDPTKAQDLVGECLTEDFDNLTKILKAVGLPADAIMPQSKAGKIALNLGADYVVGSAITKQLDKISGKLIPDENPYRKW